MLSVCPPPPARIIWNLAKHSISLALRMKVYLFFLFSYFSLYKERAPCVSKRGSLKSVNTTNKSIHTRPRMLHRSIDAVFHISPPQPPPPPPPPPPPLTLLISQTREKRDKNTCWQLFPTYQRPSSGSELLIALRQHPPELSVSSWLYSIVILLPTPLSAIFRARLLEPRAGPRVLVSAGHHVTCAPALSLTCACRAYVNFSSSLLCSSSFSPFIPPSFIVL